MERNADLLSKKGSELNNIVLAVSVKVDPKNQRAEMLSEEQKVKKELREDIRGL